MDVREKLVELLTNSPQLDVLDWTTGWEEAANYLIANGVTVQKWISVSEPPKAHGIYQVFGYDKDLEKTKVWYGQWSGYDWFIYDIYGDEKRFEVTHWMPLPQPPKGE